MMAMTLVAMTPMQKVEIVMPIQHLWVMMPKCLLTPLPQLTADSCTATKSGKVLTPISSNYCEVEHLAETHLLGGGEGIGYNL